MVFAIPSVDSNVLSERQHRIFSVDKHIERWGFDVEILYIARCLGYRIKEVPVSWMNSFNSKIRTGIDGIGMLRDALKARYIHRYINPLVRTQSVKNE